MKSKFLGILALGVVVSIFSVPLFAHHGYASYDTDKKIALKGTVTRWVWSNPHCMILLDASDESGRVTHWVTESENPTTLSRVGWNDKSIKVGDLVTINVIPLKNGNPVGRILDVVLPDGERLPGRVNPATEVKPVDAAK